MLKKKKINYFKLNKIKYIQKNFKYLFIIRFYNLNSKQINFLNKKLKLYNIYIYILKKSLFNSKLFNNQNSLMYLYTNLISFSIIFSLMKKFNLHLLGIDHKNILFPSKIEKLKFIDIPLNLLYNLKIYPFYYFIIMIKNIRI